MSPRIEADFKDVEPEISPIDPGIYELECREAPKIESGTTKTGKNIGKPKMTVVVIWSVINSTKYTNRRIWDQIDTRMLSTLKQLVMATGKSELQMEADGFVTEELIGKIVKAEVGLRTYKDANGNDKTVNEIKRYVFDAGLKKHI